MKYLPACLFGCGLWLALAACNDRNAPGGGATTAADSLYTVYITFDDGPFDSTGLVDKYIQIERIPITIFMNVAKGDMGDTLAHYAAVYAANRYISMGSNGRWTPVGGADTLDYLADAETMLPAYVLSFTLFPGLDSLARLPHCNYWYTGGKQGGDCKPGKALAGRLHGAGFRVMGWDLDWAYNASTRAPVQTVDEILHEIEVRLEKGGTFTPGHLVLRASGRLFGNTTNDGPLRQLVTKLTGDGRYRLAKLTGYPDRKVPALGDN
jgi:hypothetical protein